MGGGGAGLVEFDSKLENKTSQLAPFQGEQEKVKKNQSSRHTVGKKFGHFNNKPLLLSCFVICSLTFSVM